METDDLRNQVLSCGRRARAAAHALARVNTGTKNAALLAMADHLCAGAGTILRANDKAGEKATGDQLSSRIIDRLKLDQTRMQAMADVILQAVSLEDPVGKTIAECPPPKSF